MYHLVNKCLFGLECRSANAFINSHVCLSVRSTKEARWQNTKHAALCEHVTLSTGFTSGCAEVLNLLKANSRPEQHEKRNITLHLPGQSFANLPHPTAAPQCFLSGVQLGRKPSVRTLAGSQGFVTMQLTVVLIRKVWLWELRTYVPSKDTDRLRLGVDRLGMRSPTVGKG